MKRFGSSRPTACPLQRGLDRRARKIAAPPASDGDVSHLRAVPRNIDATY